MEITRYKKIKDNIYEISLDNGTILSLYDETIIKYELLLNKNIDNKRLNEITKYNSQIDAYYVALKYISKKMRSELEIVNYLTKKAFASNMITEAINTLKSKGYLNKAQYITSYINDQINLTNNGPEKIIYNLKKLGFNEDEIIIDYDFTEKIKKLITKRANLNRKLSTNALKLSITSYLITNGYPKEMFAPWLETLTVNDKNLIKQDYELLCKKYAKKYESRKLNLFIKDKLYKKGYNIEEINEVISDDVY